MLSESLARFIRDEDGSYTLWSITWFMIYVGIGGLAVDTTDVYRHQTLLQATADSAAMAGVMSLHDSTEATNYALAYAQDNMQRTSHGTVLAETDVKLGTWDFDNRTFAPGTADPNAVYVTTRREEANGNPLGMTMLRFLSLAGGGDLWWNVNEEAVAVAGVHVCHNNGLVAGGTLDIKTHTSFWNNICLIGHQGMKHRDNKVHFDDGVYAGVGCEGGCVGPSENVAFRNEGFRKAFGLTGGGTGNYRDPVRPQNAINVGDYIEAVQDMPDHNDFEAFVKAYDDGRIEYSGYSYLSDDGAKPGSFSGSSLPPEVSEGEGRHKIYNIDCSGNFDLPNGTYRNVAIITNCTLKLGGTYDMSNVLLASTATGGEHALHASGHTDLGAPNCGEGGGVEIYTLGDIHFAAGGNITNTRILSGGDVHFAAKAQGPIGVHIEAQGDIFAASGSNSGADFGLCPNDHKNGANVLTYRLMQ